LPRPALTVFCRMASELDKPRLLRVQLQLELFHSFFQFRPEPFGIVRSAKLRGLKHETSELRQPVSSEELASREDS